MRLETLWASEPMRIGKHDWRVGVGVYSICGDRCRCTFHQWRAAEMHGHKQPWREAEDWPTYDDHASNDGLPRTLAKLWAREKQAAEAILAGQGNFPTELTPEGEQTVIPGCERNASPKAVQLDLFG